MYLLKQFIKLLSLTVKNDFAETPSNNDNDVVETIKKNLADNVLTSNEISDGFNNLSEETKKGLANLSNEKLQHGITVTSPLALTHLLKIMKGGYENEGLDKKQEDWIRNRYLDDLSKGKNLFVKIENGRFIFGLIEKNKQQNNTHSLGNLIPIKGNINKIPRLQNIKVPSDKLGPEFKNANTNNISLFINNSGDIQIYKNENAITNDKGEIATINLNGASNSIGAIRLALGADGNIPVWEDSRTSYKNGPIIWVNPKN